MLNTLIEIKKGETGRGILKECDGYVSIDIKDNKSLYESVGDNPDYIHDLPRPFVVNAVFQKYGVENANGRVYPETVLKREVDKYQQAVKERRAFGECNHPDGAVIDVERIAMNVIELHWEGRTLVGKIEIPISEGFRKYGIISCLADLVAHWIISGLRIGVSSRAIGTVSKSGGVLLVNDDLELIGFDVVATPSTPNAYITKTEDGLEPFIDRSGSGTDTPNSDDKYSELMKWLNR